jgi:hypothetical protein
MFTAEGKTGTEPGVGAPALLGRIARAFLQVASGSAQCAALGTVSGTCPGVECRAVSVAGARWRLCYCWHRDHRQRKLAQMRGCWHCDDCRHRDAWHGQLCSHPCLGCWTLTDVGLGSARGCFGVRSLNLLAGAAPCAWSHRMSVALQIGADAVRG